MAPIAQFFLTAGVAYLLCFPVHRLLEHWRVIDQPNLRSSHVNPVVRGGGIAVLATAIVMSAFDLKWPYGQPLVLIAVAGFVLAAVSFIDDLISLSARLRFAVQAGAACAALVTLGAGSIYAYPPMAVAGLAAVCFIWIVGYTNAFNFMDGINGLAAIQTVVTGVGTAAVACAAGGTLAHPAAECSLMLAGAAAGFLPHNFPRARMFLGDVGSAPIGFFLAVFSVWLARDLGWWLLFCFGLLHANFVLDAAVTLGRRIWRRERWFESHREHYYQRLVRAGRSHAFVCGWETVLQVVAGIIVVSVVRMGWPVRVGAGGIIIVSWAVFFGYAEAKFRKFGPA